MQLRFAGSSDRGLVREQNEDAFVLSEHHHLFAVSDGMGGHADGEVASALVIQGLVEYFELGDGTEVTPAVGFTPEDLACSQVRAAVAHANQLVWREAQARRPQARGMGSTVVAAHFLQDRVAVAHVGDSRCYRIRSGEFRKLTTDHSVAEQFRVDHPGELDQHLSERYQHMLMRAMGLVQRCEIDTGLHDTATGDIFLLCSDGLTNAVRESVILHCVGDAPSLETACSRLIAAANAGGGEDNITVVLVEVARLSSSA